MPNWYKDAIVYELHVRSFFDSNGDGVGDFEGLLAKLDYLSDLGVSAVWLLPFYPSPLKDDGYDIANYFDIHPAYGTLHNFREFLQKAHRRGIRVITELVINHTSDQHEWFQKSRRATPGEYWRDYYVWSDDPSRYKDARIIFKDYETSNWAWDPIAKSYYWHRFYSHQPDLNFDNPEVKKAIFKVVDFWFSIGVDGMRLDAIPYLFERENTSCENLPETHQFLKELRRHIDSKYSDRILIAEANQWPEDAISYFGNGDECHMCFHFPLMPRLFMAIKTEDRYAIIDILKQTPEIPENCHWAMFLRNHDELTLEMVTDEERDYMYRVYTSDPRARINLGIRHRLAPLLGNDRRQIELLFAILFSLTGAPIIYYGDEIAMGDNIFLGDRNGVRTPFQWSADRNAGFSRADPQSLYLPINISPEYHYEAVNVENQQNNPHSLLWAVKNMIALRKNNAALSRGSLEILNPENASVLAFFRKQQDQVLLIVANLSRRVQCVELDLSEFQRRIPIEMSSRADFPAIGSQPYFLTLGPYGFYWFELDAKESVDANQLSRRETPPIEISSNPIAALEDNKVKNQFERNLQTYLPKVRWFTNKQKHITSCAIFDVILVPHLKSEAASAILMVKVFYRDGDPDQYVVVISSAVDDAAKQIQDNNPGLVVGTFTRSDIDGKKGIYYDAMSDADFGKSLVESSLRKRKLKGKFGTLSTEVVTPIKKEWLSHLATPSVTGFDQSNSSFVFSNQLFFKLFRKLETGENPEVELGRYLTKQKYPQSPTLIAEVTYERRNQIHTLGVISTFVPSEANAFSLMLNHVSRFCDDALSKEQQGFSADIPTASHFGLLDKEVPPIMRELSGYTLELAKLLGQRTAQLHSAFSASSENPAFSPETTTTFYQRGLYQSLRNATDRALKMLEAKMRTLGEAEKKLAETILKNRDKIDAKFFAIRGKPISAKRIRFHGDYHLGQVLFTGKDFYIIDFEGEPLRSVGERRLKRVALRDVAGMLRSFDYVTQYYLKEKLLRVEDRSKLELWLNSWRRWVGSEFARGYFELAQNSLFFPRGLEEARDLTDVFILEKALYELSYELSTRPEWAIIPLTSIVERIE